MSLSKSDLQSKILSNIQTDFPIPSNLTSAQQTAWNTAQSNIAKDYANAVIDEVKLGVVNSTGADPQGGTVTSTGAMT